MLRYFVIAAEVHSTLTSALSQFRSCVSHRKIFTCLESHDSGRHTIDICTSQCVVVQLCVLQCDAVCCQCVEKKYASLNELCRSYCPTPWALACAILSALWVGPLVCLISTLIYTTYAGSLHPDTLNSSLGVQVKLIKRHRHRHELTPGRVHCELGIKWN